MRVDVASKDFRRAVYAVLILLLGACAHGRSPEDDRMASVLEFRARAQVDSVPPRLVVAVLAHNPTGRVVQFEHELNACDLRVRLFGADAAHPVWDSRAVRGACVVSAGVVHLLRLPPGATEVLARRVIPVDSIRNDSIPPGRYHVQVTLRRPISAGDNREADTVDMAAGDALLR